MVLSRRRYSSAGGLGGRGAGGGVARPASSAGGPGRAGGGRMTVSRGSRSSSGRRAGSVPRPGLSWRFPGAAGRRRDRCRRPGRSRSSGARTSSGSPVRRQAGGLLAELVILFNPPSGRGDGDQPGQRDRP